MRDLPQELHGRPLFLQRVRGGVGVPINLQAVRFELNGLTFPRRLDKDTVEPHTCAGRDPPQLVLRDRASVDHDLKVVEARSVVELYETDPLAVPAGFDPSERRGLIAVADRQQVANVRAAVVHGKDDSTGTAVQGQDRPEPGQGPLARPTNGTWSTMAGS